MLHPVNQIQARHHRYLRDGSVGRALQTCAFESCRLIEEFVTATPFDFSRDERTIRSIGARTFNYISAAATLAHSGYWAASSACLRDIVECSQLLEYFQHKPDEISAWSNARGKAVHNKFGFGKIRKRLDSISGMRDFRGQRFSDHSDGGSHPSLQGLAFQMDGDVERVGPFDSPKLFKWFLFQIADESTLGAWQFFRTIDGLGSRNVPVFQQFPEFRLTLLGARQFLNDGLPYFRDYFESTEPTV